MTKILRGDSATEKASTMKKTAVDASGWEVTYIDEDTDESWILDFPESELHGGGAPRLTLVAIQKSKSGPKQPLVPSQTNSCNMRSS